MMYDGSEPPESVTIERVCSSNSVHAEGYTDSKGRFSFNLGQNVGMFADASTSVFPELGQQGGLNSTSNNSGPTGATSNANQESLYWDCELRARLPGYRSDTVSLAGRRMLDSPDIGVILLYPIAGIQGLTASATSGQAPKDARKSYQRGQDAVKKSKPDQAEQEFRKAVQLYPRYAEAWRTIEPQLAWGSCTPSPMKLSDASTMIPIAISKVAWTITGDQQFLRTFLIMMSQSFAPCARWATT